MKHFTFPAIILLLLTIGSHELYGQDINDEQALTELIASYARARETQDEKLLHSIIVDDADQLVSSGVWRAGKDTMMKGMINSSQVNPGERVLTVDKIRLLSDSVAIVDCKYLIKSEESERQMWSTFIAVKVDRQWKIAAIRNMLPANRN